ncbi:MAG: hypothetical protein MHM6MM_006215, partial [Cercozoa sp. M6MM]
MGNQVSLKVAKRSAESIQSLPDKALARAVRLNETFRIFSSQANDESIQAVVNSQTSRALCRVEAEWNERLRDVAPIAASQRRSFENYRTNARPRKAALLLKKRLDNMPHQKASWESLEGEIETWRDVMQRYVLRCRTVTHREGLCTELPLSFTALGTKEYAHDFFSRSAKNLTKFNPDWSEEDDVEPGEFDIFDDSCLTRFRCCQAPSVVWGG